MTLVANHFSNSLALPGNIYGMKFIISDTARNRYNAVVIQEYGNFELLILDDRSVAATITINSLFLYQITRTEDVTLIQLKSLLFRDKDYENLEQFFRMILFTFREMYNLPQKHDTFVMLSSI